MFKMKGLPGCLKTLAFFSLLFNISAIRAQGLAAATDLLHQKETELIKFVAAVEANARNCDALVGCSNLKGGCSRSAWFLSGTKGDQNYQCLDVANNTLCGPRCTQRNFDFSKSFVRYVDEVKEHVGRTVCTHRHLDDLFRISSMNNSSHLFRVFFGASNGTTRLYPGVDEECDYSYDCRLRPWFIESTDVPKGVTLLVDSGLAMRTKPDGDSSGKTYLDHAKATALKVLEKLGAGDAQDYANIICFDGNGITQQPIAKSKIYSSSLYQNFKENLDIAINLRSTKDPNATHIGNAINEAILAMDSVPETYLKVVIVLTSGGQFDVFSPAPYLSPNSGVNLFVYNFLPRDEAPECNNNIRASSETIPDERIENPLYALESYFSFLAKVHRSFIGNRTDFGQKYTDASRIDSSTLTISRAAFGPNGELLGVVGIDFFETKVQEQYNIAFKLIVEAANSSWSGSFNVSAITLPSVCFNHTKVCSNLESTSVDGLCGTTNGDAKIGCCGACKPKKTPLGAILGGTAGGVAGLFAIATVLYCLWHCSASKLEKKPTSHDLQYSGSDE